MKKSNIILIAVFGLTILWTIITSLLGASAVKEIRKGRMPGYIFSPQQLKTLELPSSSEQVRELTITTNHKIRVNITSGKAFSAGCKNYIARSILISNNNGIAMIRLDYYPANEETIDLVLPFIPLLRIDSAFYVCIRGMNQPKLELQFDNVLYSSLDSCRFGKLLICNPQKGQRKNVEFGKMVVADSILVSMNGFGSLTMGIRGKVQNQLYLSDHIEVRAEPALLRQLSILPFRQ